MEKQIIRSRFFQRINNWLEEVLSTLRWCLFIVQNQSSSSVSDRYSWIEQIKEQDVYPINPRYSLPSSSSISNSPTILRPYSVQLFIVEATWTLFSVHSTQYNYAKNVTFYRLFFIFQLQQVHHTESVIFINIISTHKTRRRQWRFDDQVNWLRSSSHEKWFSPVKRFFAKDFVENQFDPNKWFRLNDLQTFEQWLKIFWCVSEITKRSFDFIK